MGWLITNEWLLLPVFGIAVFIFFFLMSDKMIAYLAEKSLGNKGEIMDLLDKMFVEVDEKQLTIAMLLVSFGLGSITFLAFWPHLITGMVFGSVVTIIGWTAPKLIIKSLWDKRCGRLVNQMVDGMTIMANGIKAGLGVTQSMDRVIENMKGPLPQEFKIVLNKIRLGMSVEEALNEFGERIPKPDVQMFVTSINILKETGGNLSETFATIESTIRDRQKIERKIEAMTAQGIMQGVIITLVPFFLLIVYMLVQPSYIEPLFSTVYGWIALSLMLFLQVLGGVMIKKVVTIKV